MKNLLAKSLVLLIAGISYFGCSKTKTEAPIPPAVIQTLEEQNNKIQQLEQTLEDLKEKQFQNKGYDNSSAKLSDESIGQMLDAVYQVKVSAIYEHKTRGHSTSIKKGGSAFLVESRNGRQYFVTCNHVVDTEGSISALSENEHYELEQKQILLIKDNEVCGVNILYQSHDKTRDLAILVSKTDLVIEKKIDFADKELEKGDIVYVVGYPRGVIEGRWITSSLGKLITQGIILGPGTDSLTNYIYISATFDKGNSGGPLYVLEDGKPKFAGIAARTIGANGVYAAVHYRLAKNELDRAIKNLEGEE